jgi:hypothetical protein
MRFGGVDARAYDFALERSTPPDPRALERWKRLKREGWDVEALVAVDGSTMVILACRYRDELKAASA